MGLWTWWEEDPQTPLPSIHSFSVFPERDQLRIAQLAQLSAATVHQRFDQGHRCYVARVGSSSVAYGWVAEAEAEIGELQLAFTLPTGTRYLWDFATLPEWRGQGLYPRLLQAIMTAERASRFWIAHAPENSPSAQGIQRAGFRPVGRLSFLSDGRAALAARDETERSLAGAYLLDLPLACANHTRLNPCWRCFIARRRTLTQSPRLCGEDCTCTEAAFDLQ
ncbi:MAG: hypothetical protein OHK0015_14830 [Chloroflexi bacterium OHK40]